MLINNNNVIRCRDCHVVFVVTAGERNFYAARGHFGLPKFCRDCRIRRRAQFAMADVMRVPPNVHGWHRAHKPS